MCVTRGLIWSSSKLKLLEWIVRGTVCTMWTTSTGGVVWGFRMCVMRGLIWSNSELKLHKGFRMCVTRGMIWSSSELN